MQQVLREVVVEGKESDGIDGSFEPLNIRQLKDPLRECIPVSECSMETALHVDVEGG